VSNGLLAVKKIDVKVVIYRGASANMSWLNPFNYLKFFHPRVDYAICNSNEIRDKFLAVPFYRSDKAITIYKGHDTKWYEPIEAHDIRNELEIDKDGLLLVTVANNRKVKAIPDLLKAMNLIPKESKISLLVIGSKMDTFEIKRLRNASGRDRRIHFLGNRKDALNIVAACDIFVLTSIGSESLTKSVIEAMAMGVVPLITDLPGNKPLIDDGINGFIFKKSNPGGLAEKIMYVYQNSNLLKSLAEKAKLKIETDINIKETIRKYADFYMGIIN
jgi:glycosyltransferase involved in cell wall biosynthesis